jgi:hypothetical protein
MRRVSILATVLGAGLLSNCAVQPPPTVNPYPAVPAPLLETIPKPPVTAEPLIWQPGHWDWTGNGYTWASGQYVPAQGHGNLWAPGWWSRMPAGWVWQPPHWTS